MYICIHIYIYIYRFLFIYIDISMYFIEPTCAIISIVEELRQVLVRMLDLKDKKVRCAFLYMYYTCLCIYIHMYIFIYLCVCISINLLSSSIVEELRQLLVRMLDLKDKKVRCAFLYMYYICLCIYIHMYIYIYICVYVFQLIYFRLYI